MRLTKPQRAALEIASERGVVVAGYDVVGRGHVNVSASAIRALAARGLVRLSLAGDGGMGGVITDAGHAVLKGGTE